MSGETPRLDRRAISLAAILAAALLLPLVLSARADAYVYWGNQTIGGSFPGAVGRALLDGSGVDQTFITGADATCGPAVNSTHVFWANRGNSEIGRASLDGSGATQGFIDTGTSLPCGVALNPTHVFWANGGVANSIGRADLDGTGVNNTFITGANDPLGVAVNGTHAFWGNGGAAATRGVGRADLDGTGADPTFIATAEAVRGVAVNSTHVYWADANGIGRANLDGTGANPGFISSDNACGVAVNDTHVFWARQSPGFIGRAGLDGSDVDESFIPTGGTSPCGVALDQLPNTTDAAVACAPTGVVVAEATTCTVTVTDSADDPTTPTGNVDFGSNTSDGSFSGSGSCTLVAIDASSADCSVDYTPGQVGSGSHLITGSYEGDNEHAADDGAFSVSVAGRSTSSDLDCAPSSVVVSQPTICTATVTDTDPEGSASAPAGTVDFGSDVGGGSFSGGGACTLSADGPDESSCSVTYTPGQVGGGTHGVSGGYQGDPVHAASQDLDLVSVSPRETEATVACAPSGVTVSQPTTCTATVTDTDPEGSASAPAGTVDFGSDVSGGSFSGGGVCTLGATGPDSSGCSVAYTPAAVGSEQISGQYPGDPVHAPSLGAAGIEVGPLPPPRILNLRLTPRRFAIARRPTRFGPLSAAARRGTKVRFFLTEAATVRFVVFSHPRRAHPNHRPRHPAKAFARRLARGSHAVGFTGRLPTRRFRPGRYRLVAVAVTPDGRRSNRPAALFRIVRP